MFKYVLAAIAVVFSVNVANAATFTVHKYKNSDDSFVLMKGATEAGDLDRLKAATEHVDINPWSFDLLLDGPGGDGQTMKDIIKWMENRNVTTVVPSNAKCYSACAAIWAHGLTRYIHSSAELGFHTSSIAISQPDATKYLRETKESYGWNGIQYVIQSRQANDLKWYSTFNVADVNAFVAMIAIHGWGPEFWMVTKENVHIIGAQYY